MLIGIEAERANLREATGVEHYAQQLILNLAKIDHENQYVLYLRGQPEQWLKDLPSNFRLKVIPFPVFWTQIRISLEMLFNPVDCLFIMASALPIIHPRNSVVTIHDIAWEYYPETFSAFMLRYLKFSTWYAVKFARRVIAVSQQTKNDLIKKYKLPADKISVVYHGFDMSTEMRHSPDDEKKKIAGLPGKYILYISTLQPRKNVIGLIDAFIAMKKEKNVPHSLVLVGGKGWLYDKIMEKISGHPEIIYCGYGHDRFAYLEKADLLVQPSFYEGFGMSVLDAFAMRVPVACSDVSSLPEVAGDAAEYFDPHSIDSMKEAMYKVISDRELRQKLIEKGAARVKQFTWSECAQQTLKILTNANANK